MALIESIGDTALTVGLSFAPLYAKIESGEWSDTPRWSQAVIDLADGDPSKGDFLIGSPLAVAYAVWAVARDHLGRPGWRDDRAIRAARTRRFVSPHAGCNLAHVYTTWSAWMRHA